MFLGGHGCRKNHYGVGMDPDLELQARGDRLGPFAIPA